MSDATVSLGAVAPVGAVALRGRSGIRTAEPTVKPEGALPGSRPAGLTDRTWTTRQLKQFDYGRLVPRSPDSAHDRSNPHRGEARDVVPWRPLRLRHESL